MNVFNNKIALVYIVQYLFNANFNAIKEKDIYLGPPCSSSPIKLYFGQLCNRLCN